MPGPRSDTSRVTLSGSIKISICPPREWMTRLSSTSYEATDTRRITWLGTPSLRSMRLMVPETSPAVSKASFSTG